MAYTRIYPLQSKSYSPSNNPILEGIGTLSAGLDTLSNVSPAYITAMTASPGEWAVTIYLAPNTSDVHTYSVSAVGGSIVNLTLNDGASTPFAATESGQCRYRIVNNTSPSGYDNVPEAVLFEVPPGGKIKFMTAAGEYVELNGGLFTAYAIYNISILEIFDTGGAKGVLLGSSGYNGSPLIP